MTTFVLVPGACHGGWWYHDVVAGLEAHGHRAVPLTLTGLDPHEDEACHATLETHIDDVAEVILRELQEPDAGPLVLVGHSYAGIVITAAADRLADRVDALVYLDAHVPEDGESCFGLTNDEQRSWFIEGSGRSGTAVEPLPFFDQRARPHPLGSLVQQVTLTGAWRSVPVRHYVAATQGPEPSPFALTRDRIASDDGWLTHRWDTRHNVLHDGPARVLGLLLEVAATSGGDRSPRSVVHRHHERDRIALGSAGASLTVLLDTDDTNGSCSIYRWHLAEGSRGPDPHFHLTYAEAFTVEAGTIDYFDGHHWHTLNAGDSAHAPPGAVHALKKRNDEPADLLLILTPGTRREDYFRALGLMTDPTEDTLARLHRAHDNHYT